MNTVTVVICLALLVTVASGLGSNSYNRYPSFGGGNSRGSRGGRFLGNSGLNTGHRGGYGRKYYFHLLYIKNFCFDQYYGQQLLSCGQSVYLESKIKHPCMTLLCGYNSDVYLTTHESVGE